MKKKPVAPLPHCVLKSRDGTALDVYASAIETTRAVIFVNAYWVPPKFLEPLAADLAAVGIRLITWDARGLDPSVPIAR